MNDQLFGLMCYQEDLHGVIIGRLAEYCVANATVAVDFGCGVGRYLPHLASRCKQVGPWLLDTRAKGEQAND